MLIPHHHVRTKLLIFWKNHDGHATKQPLPTELCHCGLNTLRHDHTWPQRAEYDLKCIFVTENFVFCPFHNHTPSLSRVLWHTVYPKKYAHGFCFAVLCCGYTLTDFPISIRLTSLALWQSNDCPSARKATLMNMDKYFMWIHYGRLHNHNKAKHNKTMCIFLGIYCMFKQLPISHMTITMSSRYNELNICGPPRHIFYDLSAINEDIFIRSALADCTHSSYIIGHQQRNASYSKIPPTKLHSHTCMLLRY